MIFLKSLRNLDVYRCIQMFLYSILHFNFDCALASRLDKVQDYIDGNSNVVPSTEKGQEFL